MGHSESVGTSDGGRVGGVYSERIGWVESSVRGWVGGVFSERVGWAESLVRGLGGRSLQ